MTPTAVPARHSHSRRNLNLLVALILAVTAATRLPAPWRMGIENDEMHHLESWRNRYRTNDIYPIFLQRLEATHQVGGKRLEWLKRLYHSSPLVQRGLIILVDPQPPLFPVLAEGIEAATHSSLTALRFLSVLASLLAVYLMFRVGVLLRDVWLGCWLAGLMAVYHAARVYAGIGRPYALGQLTVVAVFYAYLVDRRRGYPSPWRFLLCALLAQATQWFAWLSIAPLVLAALGSRFRRDKSIARLLRQTWWYGLLSLLLLAEMVVQLRNPIISAQAGVRGWRNALMNFSIDSPLADLASFGAAGLWIGGGLFAAMVVAGVVALTASQKSVNSGRGVLLAALVCSAVGIVVLGESWRLILNYLVAVVIVAGIGCRVVFASERASVAGVAVLVVAMGAVAIFHPTDPYRYIFRDQTPYEPVAARLKAELRPGDTWAAWPYFRANVLYRSGNLPEPVTPDRIDRLEAYIEGRRAVGDCYVFVCDLDPDLPGHPVLKTADRRWTFPDYGNIHFNLLKFSAASPTSRP